jgi:hypothetical protein
MCRSNRIELPAGSGTRKLPGPVVDSLVNLTCELHPLCPQAPLYLSHVTEGLKVFRVAVPARVEGEDVAFEHALEQTDNGVAQRCWLDLRAVHHQITTTTCASGGNADQA